MSDKLVQDPEGVAMRVEALHTDALFNEDEQDEKPAVLLTPFAEQHYLLGLAALDQAKAHFRLSNYFLIRKD